MKEVKAVFIGPAQVGKTILLERMQGKPIPEEYVQSIGTEYRIFQHNGKEITAYDLGSYERGIDAAKSCLRGTQILVCCFDLSKNIDEQATYFRDLIEPNLITEEPEIILVGTKYDLIEPEQKTDNLLENMKNALKEKVTDPLFQKALTKEIETFSVNSFTNENLNPLYESLFETAFGAYDQFLEEKEEFTASCRSDVEGIKPSSLAQYETEVDNFTTALDKIAEQHHKSEFHEHCQSLLQATQAWMEDSQNQDKKTKLKTEHKWIKENSSCHLSLLGKLWKALGKLLRKVKRSEFLCRKGKEWKLHAYENYAFFKSDDKKQTPEKTKLFSSMSKLKHKVRFQQYNTL